MYELSVLIPVYNQQSYIEKAIKSVLNQTLKNFEIVVINDGSTDKTLEIIKSFNDKRLKIYSTKNKGIISALNYGLIKCKSDIIARFDGDDIMFSNRLYTQLNFFKKNNPILLGSNALIIDSKSNVLGKSNLPLGHEIIKSSLKNMNPAFFHPSVMFNKKKIIELGGYNKWAIHAEDYDLWLHLSKKGKLINIKKPLIKYRVHKKSISRLNKAIALENCYSSFKNFKLNDNRLTEQLSEKYGNELRKNSVYLLTIKINKLIWLIRDKDFSLKILNIALLTPFIILRKILMRLTKYFI